MTKRTSDVGTGPFEPWPTADVHVEHGAQGARQAATRGDIVIVVDVLSFSTTTTIAIERGARVLSLSGDQIDQLGGRDAVSKRYGAHIVAKSRDDVSARFTLSPASLGSIEVGDRVVLTSLNGALLVAAGSDAPALLIGSIRSATATAAAVSDLLSEKVGSRATIVAADERWSSVAPNESGVRPALEDLIGVGAIASKLAERGHSLSIEADSAAALADRVVVRLDDTLQQTVSGRELIARGFTNDVQLAAAIDVSPHTAIRQVDGFFDRAAIRVGGPNLQPRDQE